MLFVLYLSLVGSLALAAKNPTSNIAFVSYPESYNAEQAGSSGLYHGAFSLVIAARVADRMYRLHLRLVCETAARERSLLRALDRRKKCLQWCGNQNAHHLMAGACTCVAAACVAHVIDASQSQSLASGTDGCYHLLLLHTQPKGVLHALLHESR